MSCNIGDASCETPRRRAGLATLGVLTVAFIVLSVCSFIGSRGQVTPQTVSFGPYTADDGKRVFQAYDCMGCHTMVGNGGYLAPDLTDIYKHAGPAWLASFLPSAGTWPTETAVAMQLLDANLAKDAGAKNISEYLKKFPGAATRLARRGGAHSLMPNLPIQADEVGKLIAYLKYTAAMDKEGWPPAVKIEALDQRLRLAHGGSTAATSAAPAAAPAEPAPADPVAHGAKLVKDLGCLACHATDGRRLVGPGWGGLLGSTVTLADGHTVTVDDAYLRESIVEPNAKVVAGFPAGTMPIYGAVLQGADVTDIVAYLKTLEK